MVYFPEDVVRNENDQKVSVPEASSKTIESTLAGLEPTRDKPNRFLVDRLNHSAKVSVPL